MCNVSVQEKVIYVLIDGVYSTTAKDLNLLCVAKCGNASIECKKRKELVKMLDTNY